MKKGKKVPMETLLGNIRKFQYKLYYRIVPKYKKRPKKLQDKYFAFG
jgi:hypothetical protein